MECSIINRTLSLLMTHLALKTPNFSAFHWSPHGGSVFRNHESSTFAEKDRNKLNYRIELNRTRLCGLCIAAIAGYA